jgi:chromosome segregation ATPase
MKNRTLLLAFLSAAAITAGCDKPRTTSEQLDNVQEKTAAAAQDLKDQDYTYAQKTEFTEKMQTQLAEINKDLDLLAARIEKSSDAVKAEATPKLQALRDQAAKLNTQLDETRNATESTWDSVKATSKKAYAELKDGFTQARQWLSEKIAP